MYCFFLHCHRALTSKLAMTHTNFTEHLCHWQLLSEVTHETGVRYISRVGCVYYNSYMTPVSIAWSNKECCSPLYIIPQQSCIVEKKPIWRVFFLVISATSNCDVPAWKSFSLAPQNVISYRTSVCNLNFLKSISQNPPARMQNPLVLGYQT